LDSFDWAFDAFNAGKFFTALDIETTGLDSRRDRIVEIGAIRFSISGVAESYSQLVDPGISMPAEAGRVNNISDAMLAGQPGIQEVLPVFVRLAADSIILAHNAPFDCGFINQNLSRLYDDGYVPFAVLPNRIADSLLIARRLLPGKPHNLQELAAYFNIKSIAAHRALDDARLCMNIFTCFVKHGMINDHGGYA
jgi:DNA polymerase-3 subunit epsilon